MELNPLLQAAFEAFPNFVIVDANAKVIYLNNVYARLLGITQSEAIGKPVTEVIPRTKMDQIVKTGEKETGSIMTLYDHTVKHNINVVCNRIPLIDHDKIIGAVAMTTFDQFSEIYKLYEEIEKMKEQNQQFKQTIAQLKNENGPMKCIIGSSPAIIEIKKTISDFAKSNLSVLLTGETGVGKEVFANALHELSNRRLNSFVKINCAAIPKDLLESELFGYEEGAFTGARKQGKIGKFELADQGTLLLDEIGEMPLPLQSKLLRVLQEKEIERVGGLTPKKVNVRIICSTNRNIQKLVAKGRFREDLYYRINTVELPIPPLRQRLSDIPALCDYFIDKINQENGIHTKGIRQEVIDLFQSYSWPGNIRELEHVMERLAYLNQDDYITLRHCDFFKKKLDSDKKTVPFSTGTLQHLREQAEYEAIMNALSRTGGNKTKTAEILDIDRSLLYDKMKKYNIKL